MPQPNPGPNPNPNPHPNPIPNSHPNQLWSTLAPAADGPAGAQCAEGVAATSVRALLGHATGGGGGAQAYVLCTLSGRTYVHTDSRAVFSVFR